MVLGVEMSKRDGRGPGSDSVQGAGAASQAGGGAGARRVHVSVLAEEVVEQLGALDPELADGWILDLTLGAGGHTALLLEALPNVRVLGIDQDPEVLEHARARLAPYGSRVRVRRGRMSSLEELLHAEGIGRVVAILVDLGVSSLQLDSAPRGFSFLADGPLDMRMDPDQDRTAAEVVNTWDENDLADLFYYEGGETRARKIARVIVESRRRAPFRRTLPLADLIENAIGRRGRTHPATKAFQALRRAVNQEGEELEAALDLADRWLVDRGRLAVISFHSGEDGAVKRFLARGAEEGRWKVLTKRPLRAAHAEVRANPRARSASLRVAERVRLEDPSRGAAEGEAR